MKTKEFNKTWKQLLFNVQQHPASLVLGWDVHLALANFFWIRVSILFWSIQFEMWFRKYE